MDLTKEEEKAVKAMRRLAKIWPNTLMLMSNGVGLRIIKLGEAEIFLILKILLKQYQI